MAKPTLIQYVNLVHKHGLSSKQVTDLVEKHADNATFQRRVKVLNTLFRMRLGLK